MRENQMQTTITESRRMFRRFVTVRYWNYSLGVAIGVGLAIAGSQIVGGGYWVKLVAALAAAVLRAVLRRRFQHPMSWIPAAAFLI